MVIFLQALIGRTVLVAIESTYSAEVGAPNSELLYFALVPIFSVSADTGAEPVNGVG